MEVLSLDENIFPLIGYGVRYIEMSVNGGTIEYSYLYRCHMIWGKDLSQDDTILPLFYSSRLFSSVDILVEYLYIALSFLRNQ